MRRSHLRVVVTRHAFKRAKQRGISPDLAFEVLKSGKLKRFGKNRARIEKRFKTFAIACVDEFCGNTRRIVTVEKRLKK